MVFNCFIISINLEKKVEEDVRLCKNLTTKLQRIFSTILRYNYKSF
jgi:hypothetical protein